MKKLLLLFVFTAVYFCSFAQTDTLVTNTAQLVGTGSNDADNVNGGIVKYQWSQISGPATTIVNASTSVGTVVFPSAGVYVYQLTVTNKAGLTDSQTIQVTMLAGDNKPHAVIQAIPILKMPPNK